MIPSGRQEVVYDTWTSTDSNMLIQAVAGSGKTTTLMGILERSEYRTLFLAFNKSIQEEIQLKIDEKGFKHAKALTIHSLGLTAIKNYYGHNNIIVNNSKSYQLMRYLEKVEAKTYSKISWEDRIKISMTLSELHDTSRLFMTDDLNQLSKSMIEMDKFYYKHDLLPIIWESFLQIREASYVSNKIEIDFIDMVYLVVKNKLMIPIQPYYLMVDECQDLNLAQHQFIDLLVSQGDIHKWVAVGDRRQSIYGFSGAYGSSFDLFLEKDNVVELPLDVCYRCPVSIVEQANAVYDVMIPFKTESGYVDDITDYSEIQEGGMVICRNTNPLIDLYFKLLSINKKVYLKGDDILASITRFLKPYSSLTVGDAVNKINKEMKRLESIEKKVDKDRIELWRLKENYSNFMLLITHFTLQSDSISTLISVLKSMFVEIDDPDAIILCTIHKSKGLEADIVYILNEFLIPSKFAKSPMQLEQEMNLKYVARTRAKKELYYLTIKNKEEE